MAQKKMKARTLTLKLKTPGFEVERVVRVEVGGGGHADVALGWQVRTRAASLPNYISTEEELTPVALKLLQAELPISVRLMGEGEGDVAHRPTWSIAWLVGWSVGWLVGWLVC